MFLDSTKPGQDQLSYNPKNESYGIDGNLDKTSGSQLSEIVQLVNFALRHVKSRSLPYLHCCISTSRGYTCSIGRPLCIKHSG